MIKVCCVALCWFVYTSLCHLCNIVSDISRCPLRGKVKEASKHFGASWDFHALSSFLWQVEQLTDQFCNDTDILLEEKTKELLRKWRLSYPRRKLKWWSCFLRCLFYQSCKLTDIVLECWKFTWVGLLPCWSSRNEKMSSFSNELHFWNGSDLIWPLKDTNLKQAPK